MIPEARAYFARRIADYEVNLDFSMGDVQGIDLSGMKRGYAAKTWKSYQWFLNKNGQKGLALKKIARVGCLLGRVNWSKSCDAFFAFLHRR
jgi:hypothetical protein